MAGSIHVGVSRWLKEQGPTRFAPRRLLCRLGIHGPEWGGHGLQNASTANSIVGPGHRRCTHCGAEWMAYEAVTNRPYRVLAWEQTKLANA